MGTKLHPLQDAWSNRQGIQNNECPPLLLLHTLAPWVYDTSNDNEETTHLVVPLDRRIASPRCRDGVRERASGVRFEPAVVDGLGRRHAGRGVLLEQLRDEVLGLRRDVVPLGGREVEVPVPYLDWMGRDEMGGDGMRWDGIGWDGMDRDRTR